jgi:pimeloyl-ACP methyl ester carboxylesterase
MSGIRLAKPGRRFAIAAAGFVLLMLLAVFAVGWYYSNVLRSGGLEPDYTPEKLDLRVVSIEDGRIVLTERQAEHVDTIDEVGIWGVEGEAGYGEAGAILQGNGDEVTREFRLLSGTIEPGDFVRLDSFAFDGDPLTARGLPFHNVAVPSPMGEMPAWKLDGSSSTWVIFVHGWRAEREEALRVLPAVSSLGLQSLVITYRNDEEAPRSSDGLIRWGATEWQDVEAAVDYAVSEGAQSVILYGFSMGGGTAMRFLQQSDRAGAVTGAVLDAPVLDFDALLDFQADQRGVPGFVVAIGRQFAGWRFDLDYDAMDHLRNVDRVGVPILLFHGDDDDRAPIETSERLARERGDIVTYIVTKGAGHVRAWNVDPAAYEQAVRRFLAGIAGVPLP